MGVIEETITALQAFLARRLESLEARLAGVESRQDELGKRMDRLEARMDHLEAKSDRLEQKFDRLEERLTAQQKQSRDEIMTAIHQLLDFQSLSQRLSQLEKKELQSPS